MAQGAAGVVETARHGGSKPHAVVVAYPLQGHIIPVVHLALRLAVGFDRSLHHDDRRGCCWATTCRTSW